MDQRKKQSHKAKESREKKTEAQMRMLFKGFGCILLGFATVLVCVLMRHTGLKIQGKARTIRKDPKERLLLDFDGEQHHTNAK